MKHIVLAGFIFAMGVCVAISNASAISSRSSASSDFNNQIKTHNGVINSSGTSRITKGSSVSSDQVNVEKQTNLKTRKIQNTVTTVNSSDRALSSN